MDEGEHLALPQTDNILGDTAGSDYGSELDEDAVEDLLSQAQLQPLHHLVIENIEEPILSHGGSQERRPLARMARMPGSQSQQSFDGPSIEVEYDQSNQAATYGWLISCHQC